MYAGVRKALKEMDETVQVNTDKVPATSDLCNLHFFFPCHVYVTTPRKVAQVSWQHLLAISHHPACWRRPKSRNTLAFKLQMFTFSQLVAKCEIALVAYGRLVFLLAAVIPSCSPSCGVNGSCQENARGSVCVCNSGYQGDGYTCTGMLHCCLEVENIYVKHTAHR